MIILQIDTHRVAILPFEGYAPVTADTYRIAPRSSAKGVKSKSWDVHILRFSSGIEGVQARNTTCLKPAVNAWAFSGQKKLPQAPLPEASNHPVSVT